jgi:hypothetical protein
MLRSSFGSKLSFYQEWTFNLLGQMFDPRALNDHSSCVERSIIVSWTFNPHVPKVCGSSRIPTLDLLKIRLSFNLGLGLMIGFAQISRLWSLKRTLQRSCLIQVSKNSYGYLLLLIFSYTYDYFVYQTYIFTTPWNTHFDNRELYFVKMSDE